jgi:hypothetical protein
MLSESAQPGPADTSRAPALVHVCDEDGYTPLHRAAYNGRLGVLRVLLAHGADVAARTAEGWTALHSAARWGQAAAAELLLAHGADPAAVSNGGATPLHLAATQADAAVLRVLLLHPRTDVQRRNGQGETALQSACGVGRSQWIFLLYIFMVIITHRCSRGSRGPACAAVCAQRALSRPRRNDALRRPAELTAAVSHFHFNLGRQLNYDTESTNHCELSTGFSVPRMKWNKLTKNN